jgi:hypothetical protein
MSARDEFPRLARIDAEAERAGRRASSDIELHAALNRIDQLEAENAELLKQIVRQRLDEKDGE